MTLLTFESSLWRRGYRAVAGVDEAGRGPLAGPVVAAAVIFPPTQKDSLGIYDSKSLTAKKRELLFGVIQEVALSYGIGIIDHMEIDAINILRATYKAMQQAIRFCQPQPDYVLVDGRGVPDVTMPIEAIVKGDCRSLSIAAASIVAKVTRDRLMFELHSRYPEYGFRQHKGYPTKSHMQAIRAFGLSPVHRRSFRPRELQDVYEHFF
ncbi:ribonuclease HII [candidate division KSB1 bacterium]|nr:ribonuclease HII [candidate division KSB1 bacterium]RQV99875.1 MAG: ribonuclease HII [candidate division KSB1 bacterium]